jgi:S-adenosylmethionine:tRNA ribosyltransferase-isomerase
MIPVDAYDYELPSELIAQQPLADRAASRLMVVRLAEAAIEHRQFAELPDLLAPEDCLVLNDTRVVPARLVGRRTATGGRWEGLYLRETAGGLWQLICQTRGKLQPGERIEVEREPGGRLSLELVDRGEGGTWTAKPLSSESTAHALRRVGRVPLPPYIRREQDRPEDLRQYQTVFARRPGAVAAPTAGLHFNEELLARIRQKGIAIAYVTLHVGLGTFKPIGAAYVEEHSMHREWGNISAEAAEQVLECRRRGGRVVAVGTTALRLLETAAGADGVTAFSGETDLYIYPPYTFWAVDALVTNFHLPRTTLLVLVSTFAGREFVRCAYEEAIRRRYRFYSYGDAMLIL